MRSPFVLALAPLALAAACSKTADSSSAPPQGQMPPTEVTVVTLKTEQVALQAELPGRTTASLTSEVRPQISGIIKARRFEEGAKVKAGQLLYEIEPAQYRAAVDGAVADLASAKAQVEAAKVKDERYASLLGIEGVSKQEADDARAAHAQAVAAVAQKTAALEMAQINVGFTQITAPIAGTIGKSSITAGALVTAGQPTPLATIRALDPIFVDLTESSEQRLRLRAQFGSGTLGVGSTTVELVLPDGSVYPHPGKLEFAEVAVDEATGTVTLRATFPNPDLTLLPGMYVRARLEEAVDQNAILAPQQGITHDAKGNATAMVVTPAGTVDARTLVATRTIGDRWLVESGLGSGDKLIVEGLNKIGPGMPVHASEAVGSGEAAGSGSAGGKR